MMLSDLRTPEVGSTARVIMYLLRNHLQEDGRLRRPGGFGKALALPAGHNWKAAAITGKLQENMAGFIGFFENV